MDGDQATITIITTNITTTTTGGDTTMEEGMQITINMTTAIAITTMANDETEIDDARGDNSSKISLTKWSRMSYRTFWTQLMKR